MRGPTVANPTLQRSNAVTSVVTPQAVLLQFRTAGIGSRVLAKVIDLAIQAILLILLSIGTSFLGGSSAFIVGAVGLFLVIFAYPATEAVMNGQTLGKRALSIRVITADGGPVRIRHAAVRSLIGFIELFVLVPGGPVALITALLTQRSQRVGDLVAETLVVRDKTDITQPVFFNPPAGAEQLALSLDTSRLSHAQGGVLRQFVLRSWEIEAEERNEVALHLCDKVAALGIVRPGHIDPTTFISAVVFAHQRRFAGLAGGITAPPPMAAAMARPTRMPTPLPPSAPRTF